MASAWFTTRQIGPGVWLIQEPIGRVAPSFDVSVVNIYLVAGQERAALIDSGMGMQDLAALVASFTPLPVINLCTHGHWDHVGGTHAFAERLIHPLEAERLNRSYDVGQLTHIHAAPATGDLTDGLEVDLGGRKLTVLHTPGHSPGHVSLLDSATGYLFCADTCYAGTMWIQTNDADPAAWDKSLARLSECGATKLCGGHEEPQDAALARRVRDALAAALAGHSESEPFPGQEGVRKHKFDGFSILLRG